MEALYILGRGAASSRLIMRGIAYFAALAVASAHLCRAQQPTCSRDLMPHSGTGSYAQLVRLFQEFQGTRLRATAAVVDLSGGSFDITSIDFSRQAIARRRLKVTSALEQLVAMNVAAWDVPQQDDYLLVRAQLLEELFTLDVMRPWARDPLYYLSDAMSVAMMDIPSTKEGRAQLRTQLEGVVRLLDDARRNLVPAEVSAAVAELSEDNLTKPDAQGIMHPFRVHPPAGAIGWYEDLVERSRSADPETRQHVLTARAAVLSYAEWLRAHYSEMTALNGVGKERLDWVLRYVRLVPYTANEIFVLNGQERDQLWTRYAWEQHRNRAVPALVPAASADEYEARVARAQQRIRSFVEREDLLSVPDDLGPLQVYTRFTQRQEGPNLWEWIQYRDPSPDLFHATFPGHGLDDAISDRSQHAIRRLITDGARHEGWARYWEEAAERLGFYDEAPRAKELLEIFAMYRPVRSQGDIDLQLNRATLQQTINMWRKWVPMLDEGLARSDAESYLRTTPGYGTGYAVGLMQLKHLVADRKRELGERFKLREFHDGFISHGRIPIALTRREMTGADDEVCGFWSVPPIPGVAH